MFSSWISPPYGDYPSSRHCKLLMEDLRKILGLQFPIVKGETLQVVVVQMFPRIAPVTL